MPVTTIGEAMLWVAAALTLWTGWDYLTAGVRHASGAPPAEALRQAPDALIVHVLGIVGWSGSGKTTLLTTLIPLLRARGLTVSTVKHTHHGFDMDRPGKDTYRHREAGAHEVLVASRRHGGHYCTRWRDRNRNCRSCWRGCSRSIWCWWRATRPTNSRNSKCTARALGKPPIWPDQPDIVAVATDAPVSAEREVLPLNDPAAIAAWIGRT